MLRATEVRWYLQCCRCEGPVWSWCVMTTGESVLSALLPAWRARELDGILARKHLSNLAGEFPSYYSVTLLPPQISNKKSPESQTVTMWQKINDLVLPSPDRPWLVRRIFLMWNSTSTTFNTLMVVAAGLLQTFIWQDKKVPHSHNGVINYS